MIQSSFIYQIEVPHQTQKTYHQQITTTLQSLSLTIQANANYLSEDKIYIFFHLNLIYNKVKQMSAKSLDSITKKLKPDEIVVDLIDVKCFSTNDKKHDNTLIITSQFFYFMSKSSIRKTIPICDIKVITLATYSEEMIIHCLEDDVRLESSQNIKIINNLLKIRDKVQSDKSPITVMLERERSLVKFIQLQNKKHFWSGLFNRKQQEQRWRWSERKSFCALQVTDKNFVLQISKKMYQSNYLDVTVLYISGTLGFIFNQLNYQKEVIDSRTNLFRHKQTKQMMLMRKIPKDSQQNIIKLRKYIQNYKLSDFKQQVYYALQTSKSFEIITAFSEHQTNMEELLNQQKITSELDLVSLFYKLMPFIDNNFNVMHSLTPREIIVNDTIVISGIFCVDPAAVNVNYLAPEELDQSLAVSTDPELVNFWKIGMLLYQIGFGCLPFPIEYLAEIVRKKQKMILRFPQSTRTQYFRNFLLQILRIDPTSRGGGRDWKKRIFDHIWLAQVPK